MLTCQSIINFLFNCLDFCLDRFLFGIVTWTNSPNCIALVSIVWWQGSWVELLMSSVIKKPIKKLINNHLKN